MGISRKQRIHIPIFDEKKLENLINFYLHDFVFAFAVKKDMAFFVTNLTVGTNCDKHLW